LIVVIVPLPNAAAHLHQFAVVMLTRFALVVENHGDAGLLVVGFPAGQSRFLKSFTNFFVPTSPRFDEACFEKCIGYVLAFILLIFK
jgi:hypothetical protein